MTRILLRTLVILLVAGLVAGGIYLFAQSGGLSLIGAAGHAEGLSRASAAGLPQADGELHFDGGDSQAGFSLDGLGGVLMQLGKVAAITMLVGVVKAGARLFRRRPQVASPI